MSNIDDVNGKRSNMSLSADEEAKIRETVEAIDDAEPADVLKGDSAALARLWAPDLIVNAPNNQVVRLAEVVERMKQQTALQYSSFERHREGTIVRRNCAVTMGYEIVVPKGNVANSGKTVNRRYTNIYCFEDGGWRVIARQATNVSVQ
jgi:ketosteroid isomerase-like protein